MLIYIYFDDLLNELNKYITEYTIIGKLVIKTSIVLNLKYNSGQMEYCMARIIRTTTNSIKTISFWAFLNCDL